MYDNPWVWNGKEFDSDAIGNNHGFVYLLIDKTDNKWYVGKKSFWSIRKVKGKTKRQRKESNWKSYYGSSDTVKAAKAGGNKFSRIIVSLHPDPAGMNYMEVRLQFALNVLGTTQSYNDNIDGSWFKVHVAKRSEQVCESFAGVLQPRLPEILLP